MAASFYHHFHPGYTLPANAQFQPTSFPQPPWKMQCATPMQPVSAYLQEQYELGRAGKGHDPFAIHVSRAATSPLPDYAHGRKFFISIIWLWLSSLIRNIGNIFSYVLQVVWPALSSYPSLAILFPVEAHSSIDWTAVLGIIIAGCTNLLACGKCFGANRKSFL
jgi:hypothetical protein